MLYNDFIVLVGVFDDESISEGSTESEDEIEVVVAVHSRFETKEGELEFETGEIFEGWFQNFFVWFLWLRAQRTKFSTIF